MLTTISSNLYLFVLVYSIMVQVTQYSKLIMVNLNNSLLVKSITLTLTLIDNR